MIEVILGICIGVTLGFFLCALLTAGKITDLEKENWALREDIRVMEELPIRWIGDKDV